MAIGAREDVCGHNGMGVVAWSKRAHTKTELPEVSWKLIRPWKRISTRRPRNSWNTCVILGTIEMADSMFRSVRDDFGIDEHQIEPIRAALRKDRIDALRLSTNQEVKSTSSQYEKYVRRTGEQAARELKALEPEKLEEIAEQTTLSVIDMHRFNAKKEAEEHDAEELLKYDRRIMGILGDEIERIGEK